MESPILTRLLNQFLYQVDWGELDFLLIDLPPGTGDTQITLLQDSPIVGVILVTLPGSSSYSDLIRTTSMYENFGMPIYGLIENMSFYNALAVLMRKSYLWTKRCQMKPLKVNTVF